MNAKDLAKAHGLRVVSERRAVKEAMLLDRSPNPDWEHFPGKRGWITGAGTAMDAFVITRSALSLIERAHSAGLTVAARGDREVGLYFNPSDPAQAEFAIRAIKGKRKR